jgi:hypothetical protein
VVLKLRALPLMLFLSSLYLHGQDNFMHFSSENGLPSSETFDIMQDKKGYIWIATDGGVSRYDGYRFENFTVADGLSDNLVLNMFEDKTGKIWFSTFSGKICYYDYTTSKIIGYRFNDTLEKYLGQRKYFRSMFAEDNGELHLGYIAKGKVKISADGKLAINKKKSLGFEPWFHIEEENGKFLFYSEKYTASEIVNRLRLRIKSGRTDTSFTIPNALVQNVEMTACKRKNGGIIVTVPGFIIEFGDKGICAVHKFNDEVYHFFEDSQNRLWMSMKLGGLRIYEPNDQFPTGKFTEHFTGKAVTKAFEDNAGGTWVSTLNDGIYYLPKYTINVKKCPGLPQDKFPSLLFPADSFLLAPVDDEKIFRIDKDSARGIINLPAGHVSAIDMNKGRIFISAGGFYLFEKNGKGNKILREKKLKKPKYAYCMLFTDSFVLCGGAGFIFEISVRHPDQPKFSLLVPGMHTGKMIMDGKTILLGTSNGIFRYKDGKLLPFKKIDGESPLRISGMKKMGSRLVVSTLGGGLRIFDGNKTKTVTQQDGLLSDNIKGFDIHENSIWLASSRGINEIRLTGDSTEINSFTIANGLPMNEIKQLCIFKSAVWFVTPKGLFSFAIGKPQVKNLPVPLIIGNVHTSDTNFTGAALCKQQEIGYNRNIVIEFCGLDFRQKGNIEYRYRLSGPDTTWRSTTGTRAEFAFLNEGDYRFELNAKNQSGIWNSQPATFSFYVSPPVWKTWWFMLAAIVLLLLCISLIFLNRIRQLKKLNKNKEQIIEYRHKALIAQINPHFIFNSLNSVYYYILKEDKRNAAKYLTRFSKLMRLSLDNSMAEYISLRRDLEALQLYLELESLRFTDQFSFSISIDEGIDSNSISIPAMLLQPFVENSIRHGLVQREEKGGVLSIRISWEGPHLLCTIEDNGIGRERSAQLKTNSDHKSAGTDITQQRMKISTQKLGMQYYLEYIDNINPAGTVVKFHLPYKKINKHDTCSNN